ncbi:hypothetical protein VTO73DRAFT_5633 [Trametes versicolor]
MGLLKKMMASLSPPSAPKHLPVPLPELAVDSPPGQSWSSSGSSSCSSPSPTTPSPRSSPIAYRAPSNLSGKRTGTPQDAYADISRYSSPDPALEKKSRSRRTSSPAVDIVKPTPRRAYIPITPSTTVMNAVLPPTPDMLKPPIKGILKPPRPATAAPSEASSWTPPPIHSPRSASSASNRPSQDVPLSLHWQLLPPVERPWNPANRYPRQRLYFDITKPPSTIKIRDYSEMPPKVTRGSKIKDALAKPASNGNLSSMTIKYDKIPGAEIHIAAKDGSTVRCGEVFDAIYEFFDRVLTPDERSDLIPTIEQLNRVEKAFVRRCQDSHRAVPLAEQYEGIRFVDLLEGNTVFHGLMRPLNERRSPEKYWVIEFGPCETH